MNWGLGIEHEFFLSFSKNLTKTHINDFFNLDHQNSDKTYLVLFPFDDEAMKYLIKSQKGSKEILPQIYQCLMSNNKYLKYLQYDNIHDVIIQLIDLFLPFLNHFDGLNAELKNKIKNLNQKYFPEISNYLSHLKNPVDILKKIINIIKNETLEKYFFERKEILPDNSNNISFYQFDKDYPIFPTNISVIYKKTKSVTFQPGEMPSFYELNNVLAKQIFKKWVSNIVSILIEKQKMIGISNQILEYDFHDYGFMFEMKTNKAKNLKFNELKKKFTQDHHKLVELYSLIIFSKYPELKKLGYLQVETQSYYHGNICIVKPFENTISFENNIKRYLGSYHFWFTPPYKNNYLEYFPTWFQNLKNFACWLQWIEPLITIFFKHNDTNGESKISYRDIVNFYAAYGTFDIEKMKITTKKRLEVVKEKPPFTKNLSDVKIKSLFKPVEVEKIKYKNQENQIYFPTDELFNLDLASRQYSNNSYFQNSNKKTYLNKLLNNNIKVKQSNTLGSDIRLGDIRNNFIHGDFILYEKDNKYYLQSQEIKKDKIKVLKPKINIPKNLMGLEFRILDNMSLDNVFIIYHFCLLGLEMTKNVEMTIPTKTDEWHNLLYTIMKNGVNAKISQKDKLVFEKNLHCKFSDNFENWFYEYFEYLYQNYQNKSPILKK